MIPGTASDWAGVSGATVTAGFGSVVATAGWAERPPVEQEPARPAGDDGAARERGAPEEEAAAVPVGHGRRRPARGGSAGLAGRGVARRGTSSPSRKRRLTRPAATATTVVMTDRTGEMSGSRKAARKRDDAEPAERPRGPAQVAARGDADRGGDGQGHDHDEDVQGQLVVRAEEADDHVLRAGRLEVDDERADREDERRGAGDDPGDELGDGHRDAGGDGAGEGGSPESAPQVAIGRGFGGGDRARGRSGGWQGRLRRGHVRPTGYP